MTPLLFTKAQRIVWTGQFKGLPEEDIRGQLKDQLGLDDDFLCNLSAETVASLCQTRPADWAPENYTMFGPNWSVSHVPLEAIRNAAGKLVLVPFPSNSEEFGVRYDSGRELPEAVMEWIRQTMDNPEPPPVTLQSFLDALGPSEVVTLMRSNGRLTFHAGLDWLQCTLDGNSLNYCSHRKPPENLQWNT